ncbi:hypothetical protein BJV78DRAFT_612370 [Lactifluus subvellereus]|nr:hypothetical protein BJV78DRAFT_612370 [Lactifluus subvellereus]
MLAVPTVVPPFIVPLCWLLALLPVGLPNRMTDWRNPRRVAATCIALEKLLHVLGGLYLWEILINLDYEFSVLTGKRKLTRTFPLYLGCRWCPLVVLITQFLILDVSDGTGCQVMIVTFIFGYLSSLFASVLIILRISVLWKRNKVVIALASASCLGNTACYLYVMATSRGYWTGDPCALQHTRHAMFGIFSSFATNLLLLVLMLIGVLHRCRSEARQQGSILRFLYMQGLAWAVVFTLAEVPPVIFIILNLNDYMNVMFPTAGLIFTAIGASRLHRRLTDYLRPNGSPVRGVDNEEPLGEIINRVACPPTVTIPRGARAMAEAQRPTKMPSGCPTSPLKTCWQYDKVTDLGGVKSPGPLAILNSPC